MTRIKVAVIAAAIVAALSFGVGMASTPPGAHSKGIFNSHGTLTVAAWSFDNKNRKNRRHPTVHHGLW